MRGNWTVGEIYRLVLGFFDERATHTGFSNPL
jgi:hypothetical protein